MSSGTSFRSFENIQQSCKRSHKNSCKVQMDEILGTSSEILQSNLTIQSNSNALMEDFNSKTREITSAMQSLYFSMINLRNKLSKGCFTMNCPIINQVMTGNNIATTSHVRVEIYPLAQSCWQEIRGFLLKEMNLCIKSS